MARSNARYTLAFSSPAITVSAAKPSRHAVRRRQRCLTRHWGLSLGSSARASKETVMDCQLFEWRLNWPSWNRDNRPVWASTEQRLRPAAAVPRSCVRARLFFPLRYREVRIPLAARAADVTPSRDSRRRWSGQFRGPSTKLFHRRRDGRRDGERGRAGP